MSESASRGVPPHALDVGEYCRRVEEHLTRVNRGQIIRITGVAFETVRAWAEEGIPLSIVFQGIDQKASRHAGGRSKRPLRLEFCEDDVRALYDDWRRAVGVWSGTDADAAPMTPAQEERRRPSATRQIDRAMDRVLAASGRLDVAIDVRDSLTVVLEDMAALRSDLKRVRGAGRRALASRAADIDRAIGEAARVAAGPEGPAIVAEAARDLEPYRGRMSPPAWSQAVDAAADRLFRERLGLPTVELTLASDTDDGA